MDLNFVHDVILFPQIVFILMWSIYHSFPFWFVHSVLFVKFYFSLWPSRDSLTVSPKGLNVFVIHYFKFHSVWNLLLCVMWNSNVILSFTLSAISVMEQIFTKVHVDLFLFCPGNRFSPGLLKSPSDYSAKKHLSLIILFPLKGIYVNMTKHSLKEHNS